MSSTLDPTSPRVLPPPPRRAPVRRMRQTPLWIGGGVVLAMMGSLGWVVTHLHSDASPSSAKAPSDLKAASSGDALDGAPTGAINPFGKPAPSPIAGAAPVGSPRAPAASPVIIAPPGPGMTQVELAARKAAWEAYATQLQAAQTHHLEAERTAYNADPYATASTTTATAPGAGGGAGAAGGPPGMPGAATSGQGAGGESSSPFGSGSSPSTDYLENGVTLPVSRYELKAGDFIKCGSLTGLTNEVKGQVKAIVTSTVFDHATGLQPLIPAGSTLVGTYDNGQVNGDERLPVAFTRVIFPPPGDESLDLGQMTAEDQSGYAGWKDQVNSHEFRLLFNALLLGGIGAVTQLSQAQGSVGAYGSGYSSQQVIAGSLGQQLSQVGQAYAQKGLQVKPTLNVRPGFSCVIQLTKDIAFKKPWHASSGPITAMGTKP